MMVINGDYYESWIVINDDNSWFVVIHGDSWCNNDFISSMLRFRDAKAGSDQSY